MRDDAIILLVEDRQDDVFLMVRSLKHAGIKNPVQVASDGQEAIDYLSGHGKYSDRQEYPLPDLVLLDLKLPRIDGFEVLHWIRLRPELTGLRVVVLTSSDDIRDVNAAYALGANSFLVKPADFNHYVELSEFIADNWFHWNTIDDVQATGDQPSRQTVKSKKVYLRERKARHFYAGHDRWVDTRESALNFERIELAEAVATAENLKNVDIVLAHDQPPCDLTLPVSFPGVRRG